MATDRIRLVASDMDATLLDEHSCLPQGFAGMVHALAQKDIRFAAASGRPLYTLEEMFAGLLDTVILIGDNGGAIRWQGKDLFVSEMPAAGWRQLAKLARENRDIGMLCGLDCVYVEKPWQCYDAVFRNFYTRVTYVDDLLAVEAPADKFTIYLPAGNAQQAFDAVYSTACGGAFSVAVAGKNWVDVMNPGVHKGAALEQLGRQFSIPSTGMMAFGDTYNDAEMLTAAKYGFLMENGSAPLRAKVPFLAPPHTQAGVMQILHRVLAQDGWVCPADFIRT